MAPTTKTLAIAFGGAEDVSAEVVLAELDELYTVQGEPNDVILIVPFSRDDTGAAFVAVGDWANQVDPSYEVRLVADGTINPARAPKEIQGLVRLAGDQIETTKEWWTAEVEMLDELREKNGADVFVVVSCTEEQLGENDAHVMDLVEAADKSRIPVKAINAGMEDVQVGEPEADATPEPVAEPVAEPEPIRRRRATAEHAVTEPVAETPVQSEAPQLPPPRRRRGADEGQQVPQESAMRESAAPAPTQNGVRPVWDGAFDGLGLALETFADLVADKLAARLGK